MKKEVKKILAMLLAALLAIGIFPNGGALNVNASSTLHYIQSFQVLSDWEFDGLDAGAVPSATDMNLRLDTNNSAFAGEAGNIASYTGKWYEHNGSNITEATKFEAGKKYCYHIDLTAKQGSAFGSIYDYLYDLSDSFEYLVNGDECHTEGYDWTVSHNDMSGESITLISKDFTARAVSTPTPTPTPTPIPEPVNTLPEELKNAAAASNGSTLTYTKTGTTAYKVDLSSDSTLQLVTPMGSYYDDALEIAIYNSTGEKIQSFTQDRRNSDKTNKYSYDSNVLAPGTYYITITGTDNKNTADKTISLTINAKETNASEAEAETINLPFDGKPTELKWNQAKSGNAWVRHYYKLVVAEKAYYTIVGSAFFGGINLYQNSFNDAESMLSSTLIDRDTEILLDKGEYYLVVYGRKQGDTKLTINSRDFIDIKSITGTDYYEVYKGAKEKITLTLDPAENESSINWTEPTEMQLSFVSNYDYDSKEHLPKNEAYIYAHSLGKYTSTITTSEGVTKTISFMVKPHPTQVSNAEAVTKNKKKATLTLEWTGDGNYYKIWEKGPKDKAYKVVKEVASTQETTKVTLNKKPGQNFSYKIESCYKIAGEVVCSSTGDAVAAFTAPNKAPKIKSLKQTGSTKYTKPYTKRYWVDTTRTRLGHYEVYHLGNTSAATVKVNVGKIKGCKTYETAKNKHCSGTISGGKFVYTYSGKIKSTSEKVKIRGIWKKGKCTAYGPWSKTKSVKIKGNK